MTQYRVGPHPDSTGPRPRDAASGLAANVYRHTLDGLADFAVVQPHLSTAAKWEITKIGTLRSLFSGDPWMPPGIEPAPTG